MAEVGGESGASAILPPFTGAGGENGDGTSGMAQLETGPRLT